MRVSAPGLAVLRESDGGARDHREVDAIAYAEFEGLDPPQSILEAVLLYVNTEKSQRRNARVYIALCLFPPSHAPADIAAKQEMLRRSKECLKVYLDPNNPEQRAWSAELVNAFSKCLQISGAKHASHHCSRCRRYRDEARAADRVAEKSPKVSVHMKAFSITCIKSCALIR